MEFTSSEAYRSSHRWRRIGVHDAGGGLEFTPPVAHYVLEFTSSEAYRLRRRRANGETDKEETRKREATEAIAGQKEG